MRKNNGKHPHTETTDELVGVLTAISVVSKRLARRLVLLEELHGEGGKANAERGKRADADKGNSV